MIPPCISLDFDLSPDILVRSIAYSQMQRWSTTSILEGRPFPIRILESRGSILPRDFYARIFPC